MKRFLSLIKRLNKYQRLGLFVAVGLTVILISVRIYNYVAWQPNDLAERLRAELKGLDQDAKPTLSIQAHLRRYHLYEAAPLVGRFHSGSYTLAGYIWRPDGLRRGTVILAHGYLLHTGCFDRFIQFMLDHHYAVGAFDLPGHGLSSGTRGSIDSFDAYGEALNDFTEILRPISKGPYYLVGHSTGCDAIIEYLRKNENDPFSAIVLTAPLLHNDHWRWSQIGIALTDPFTEWVPRIFRASSSDAEFVSRLKTDPLQVRHLPMQWQRALRCWLMELESQSPVQRAITVIQGTNDTVVDWRYNLPHIQALFQHTTVHMIDSCRHDLLNEADPIRRQVMETILEVISDNSQE